jgi:hypothetical protein
MTTRKFGFQNTSGEVFPAHGCGRLDSVLRVDEAGGHPVYKLVKPDGIAGIYVVNGPNNVAHDGMGVATALEDARLVLVQDGDGQPQVGDVCGPTRRLWVATTSGSGLRAAGDVENNLVPITQQAFVRFQGMLTGDLAAAVNIKRDPSTAKARILFRKLDGDLTLSKKEVEIVNRFKNISVEAETYVKFEWLDGEWQLYAADCAANESSSESV